MGRVLSWYSADPEPQGPELRSSGSKLGARGGSTHLHRVKRNPEACWPINLAESLSSRFSEKTYLKKENTERYRKDSQHQPLPLPTHTHTHSYTHTQRYGSMSKVLATRPDGLSSIPRTHMTEGENRLWELSSDHHICAKTCMPTTYKIN